MDFSHEQRFTPKKASGIGMVVIAHVLLAGALVYGLKTTHIPKTGVDPYPVTPESPPPVKPKPPVDFDTSPVKPTVFVDPPPIDKPPIEQPYTPTAPKPGDKPTGITEEGPTTGGGGTGTGATPIAHTSTAVSTELDRCKPVYPKSAVLGEEEGTVRLKLEVGADSRLVAASVLQSSGHKDLDNAALSALRNCTFKAATQDGTPIRSSLVTDYVWSLER